MRYQAARAANHARKVSANAWFPPKIRQHCESDACKLRRVPYAVNQKLERVQGASGPNQLTCCGFYTLRGSSLHALAWPAHVVRQIHREMIEEKANAPARLQVLV